MRRCEIFKPVIESGRVEEKFKDIDFGKETTSEARKAFDRDYLDFFSKK